MASKPSEIAIIVICIGSLEFIPTIAADKRLSIKAGKPVNMVFKTPEFVNLTSDNYRGCRLYKNDRIHCVIGRGSNTKICNINMNFHVNESQAMVEIHRTLVSNGGHYYVEFVFSGWKDSNRRDDKWLNVIEESQLPSTRLRPSASFITPSQSLALTTQKSQLPSTRLRPSASFITPSQSLAFTTQKSQLPSTRLRPSACFITPSQSLTPTAQTMNPISTLQPAPTTSILKSSKNGMIAVSVGAGCAVLLLVLILICICKYHRSNEQGV